MSLTPSQLDAVSLENYGRDVCVVAGPGSGKTRVLVEYFERLVRSGVPPSRVLAITFTEKAAINMKQRLAEAFAADPAVRRELERAYVSTVHGFCARLLRENSIAAGVDPEFRVLDEHEALTISEAAVADALDGATLDSPEPMRRLMQAVACSDLGAELFGLYEAVRASGTEIAALAVQPSLPGPCFEDLLDAIRNLPRDHSIQPVAEQLAEWRERHWSLKGRPASLDHFRALAALKFQMPRGRRGAAYGQLRAVKDMLEPVHRRLLGDYFSAERGLLIELLARFDALYRQRKAALGGLDYSDLEEYAVALLRENADVRQRVRAQFDQVLMDEYQDTNGVQAALVELVRPPNRFFAVGDINQSIYGFRHANPDVFRDFRDQNGQKLVDLRENFRSREAILRTVETVLRAAPGIESRPLIAEKQFAEKVEPSIEIIVASAASMDEALEMEARWVARRIRELEGGLWLSESVQAAGFPALMGRRMSSFGDIAVLVRNSEVMDAFSRAFEEFDIPCVVSRGKGFFETRELKDMVHLARVLVNPLDETSMAAVLRSPFVELSDEGLLRLREDGNLGEALVAGKSRRCPSYTADDSAKLEWFAAALAGWRSQVDLVSIDRLLQRVLDETAYPAEPGGRVAANLEKFLALARRASGAKSLFEFVEDLQTLREANPREPDALPEDSVNAVRLMTVHAAKGLEFPVVFVSALHKGINNSPGTLRFLPRAGFGVSWRDPATGEAQGDLTAAKVREARKVREDHESDRLLYVAMSRAEEHLVLSFSNCGKKPDNWAKRVADAFDLDLEAPGRGWRKIDAFGADGQMIPARLLYADQPPERSPRRNGNAPVTQAQRLAKPTRDGQYNSNATVTDLNLFAQCPRRYFLARYIGYESEAARGEPFEDDRPDPGRLSASEFGRQVHKLLAGIAVPSPEPEALRLAASFDRSPLGRRAAQAALVEREFDFVVSVEDLVLRGQIDLWFEDGGGLVVVDYKTDEVKPPEAEQHGRRYALQLRLYALALQRMTGKSPAEAYVHYLKANRSVRVDLTPGLFDTPESIVHEFRTAQERLDFPRREAPHCRSCPFVGKLCPAA